MLLLAPFSHIGPTGWFQKAGPAPSLGPHAVPVLSVPDVGKVVPPAVADAAAAPKLILNIWEPSRVPRLRTGEKGKWRRRDF